MRYWVTTENVKIIGRTCMEQGVLWCGLSGSGIAFRMTGTKARITILGDDTTQGNETEGKARIGICVNGERVLDTMIEHPRQTFTVFESSTPKEAAIQVIKLSECAMSVIGIAEIEAEAEGGIYPEPEKERKIEFIGDSITCGFGVDREDAGTPFCTDTEDVTRAYAYKTAQKLNADYSMVSYSGYGIISGFTATDIPLKTQRVPDYYEKVGFSYGKPLKTLCLQEQEWNFSQFQPDIVVINLGTNDDSYCKDDEARRSEFTGAYVSFLKQVHQRNPRAAILCIAGLMGERIYPAVEAAVKCYIQEFVKDGKLAADKTKESGECPSADKAEALEKYLSADKIETSDVYPAVYAMKLSQQRIEDGLVSCGHPTERSHEKAACRTAEKIREILNW